MANYQNSLHIDEDRLDKELVLQPQLVLRAGLDEAEAQLAHDRKKASLAAVAAEVELDIRNDPEGHDLPKKPSEATVKAAVALDDRHATAVRVYNRVKHALDIAKAYVAALDQKGRSLKGLIELHSTNYYSDPRVPKGAAEGFREAYSAGEKKAVRHGVKRRKKRGECD